MAAKNQVLKGIIKLLKELFPTFLGVFLAFYMNDVWVDRQEQRSLQQIKQTLQDELSKNIGKVKPEIEYHQILEDSADHLAILYYKTKDKSQLPPANFWDGIGGVHLSDAAYQTAISTQNLAKMDLNAANAIAAAYSAKRNYESVLQSARSALLIKEWPNYMSWINYIRWSSNNLRFAEMEIIQTHEEALKLLE